MKLRKKLKKQMAKTAACMAVLATVTAGVFQVGLAEVQAASTPKWKTEYTKILNNWKLVEKYQDMDYLKMYFDDSYKFDRYYIYDVDKNGTPELFLYSTTMRLTEVLTYNKKLISLGYNAYSKLNKKQKELIVHGHWHGSGGSGSKEWTIYKVGQKKLNLEFYIDDMNGRFSVYNGKWTLLSNESGYYNKIYNTHVKNSVKLSSIKKYKLNNQAGLNKSNSRK